MQPSRWLDRMARGPTAVSPWPTRSGLWTRPPVHWASRYALALCFAVAATLLRLAIDPLIHDQIPYFVFVASVAISTWFCGIGGGVLVTVISAVGGNYFFVPPRHQLVPSVDDAIAMAMFAAVSLGLVWQVGRWRRTEGELARLHAETAAVLDQMPVGVLIGDASGMVRFGNAAIKTILGDDRRLSGEGPGDVGAGHAMLHPDGRPMAPADTPMARALLRGATVTDQEVHLLRADGSRRIVTTYGAPVRDEHGRPTSVVVAMMDVTERKRIEGELRRREQEVAAATLAAEVGVWTWTPETGELSVAANWRGLFGVEGDAPVTLDTWIAALHPADRARAVDTLTEARRAGGDFSTEYRVLRPDGTVRWIVDRGRAARDATGEVTSVAGANLDVTELKLTEDALREANRLKDEFLGTLSHELRTPLNAIVGWSDMLRRGVIEPDRARRAIESIHRNAQAQSALIDDVLDVSRIVSGKFRIDMQPVDLSEVIQTAAESIRPTATLKGVTLLVDLPSLPQRVTGDVTRLHQVFWNLLSNACKFTPPGGEIRVGLESRAHDVEVRVVDTGIGIDPGFLGHVFERFRQGDSSVARQHPGLGLGLAIVRHLVELHGGSVAALSRGEGQGATFTVRLPRRPVEMEREVRPARRPQATADAPGDGPERNLRGVRVLVVDDDPDAAEVATSILSHAGATVAEASHANEVLEVLGAFAPDVLLVDIAMPDTDGYTLLQRIRASGSRGARLPAVALSALARPQDQQRALASGFQVHLAKPIDPDLLVRAIAGVHAASVSEEAS